jgi:C1A family cysteine protease
MACYKGLGCVNFVDDDDCHLNEQSCNNCNGNWCTQINCISVSNNSLNIGFGGPPYVCNPYVGICEKSSTCTGSILPLCKGSCRKYLYSCVEGKGCVQDEKGKMTKSECESTCKVWDCDLDKGCFYSDTYGDYLTKAECQSGCKKHTCITSNGCILDPNGTEHYAQCLKGCVFWGCDTGCTKKTAQGEHVDQSICEQFCNPWVCNGNKCTRLEKGTGEYSTEDDCIHNCGKHSCTGGQGCVLDETGDYVGFEECFNKCTLYEYSGTEGCIKDDMGSYTTLDECIDNNYTYSCVDGCKGLYFDGPFYAKGDCSHNCGAHSCKVGQGCVLDETGDYKGLTECFNNCTLYDYSNTEGCIKSDAGQYSSLDECIDNTYTYSCVDGCKGLYFKGPFYAKGDCIDNCTPWKCDTANGCYKASDSTGIYESLEQCIDNSECNNNCDSCKANSSYCLYNGVCWAYNNITDCNSNGGIWCKEETSWNCLSDGCTMQQGNGGAYSTKEMCDAACTSWNCLSDGCTMQQGTGGNYSTKESCDAICNSKVYTCADKPYFKFPSTTSVSNSSNIINKTTSSTADPPIETNRVHEIYSINISNNSLNIEYDHVSTFSLGLSYEEKKLEESNKPFQQDYFTINQSEVTRIENELINNHLDILESYNDTDLNWACNNCNRLNTSLCGPIKNQSTCGTCWAFGTVAVMESYISKIQTENNDNNNYISLSEQYVSNVIMGNEEYNKYGHSCCGSIFHKCVTAINSIGITDTQNCPYKTDSCTGATACSNTNHSDRCIFSPSDKPHCQLNIPNSERVLKRNNNLSIFDIYMTSMIRNYQYEYLTNDHIKKLLHIYGPLVTTSHAHYITSPNIVTPISYLDTRTHNIDHQITLVGYSTTPDNIPYWIIRNSWGSYRTGTDGYQAIEMVNEPSRVFGGFGAVMEMDYDSSFVNATTSNITFA